MIALAVVTAKRAELAERIALLKKHRARAAGEYESQPEARDLVAFNLILALQSAIDLAAHVIVDEKLAPFRTSSELFERLAQHAVIPYGLAERFERALAFRELVIHRYARMDHSALHEAATVGVDDLERFAELFADWAYARAWGRSAGSGLARAETG